tara:strand:+ start:18477 stop:19010 length:534 start_codon:yes stop_codon:yes gene_type:complete
MALLKLTQNQFFGSKAYLPERMTPGATYIDIDNNDIYIYDISGFPIKFGTSADITSIVGAIGTKVEYNNQLSDGNFKFEGDAPTSHSHTVSDITDLPLPIRSYVDSTGNGIVGEQNNINLIYNVSQSSYLSGSLIVFVSGFPLVKGHGLTETIPASGQFRLDIAPESFEIIISTYSK